MDIASYAIANTPYICSEESAVSYKQQRMKQIIWLISKYLFKIKYW